MIQYEGVLRKQFWMNVEKVKTHLISLGFSLVSAQTHILPLFIGDPFKALETSRYLYEQQILIPAIRYPTVHKGTDRLRITVMATHTEEHIHRFCEALTKLRIESGLFS